MRPKKSGESFIVGLMELTFDRKRCETYRIVSLPGMWHVWLCTFLLRKSHSYLMAQHVQKQGRYRLVATAGRGSLPVLLDAWEPVAVSCLLGLHAQFQLAVGFVLLERTARRYGYIAARIAAMIAPIHKREWTCKIKIWMMSGHPSPQLRQHRCHQQRLSRRSSL